MNRSSVVAKPTPVAVWAVLWIVGVTSMAGMQNGKEVPPGGMVLLPGYTHEAKGGIDTRTGLIQKNGGPIISYDIGPGFSSFAKPRAGDKTLWVKEITREGKNVMRVNMQTDGTTVFVDIGHLSGFVAQNVQTKEELTEVLMMLSSYKGDTETVFRGR